MCSELARRPVNFDSAPEQMTLTEGWTVDGSLDRLGIERVGPPEPDGLFERARQGVLNYDFSDPTIVQGHFDQDVPPLGRDMLLELKVLGFHFLGGCRVTDIRDQTNEEGTTFGFRYDTLSGHLERGFEWFLLTKDHDSGEIQFQIEAHWRLGDFPNWWSRVGFKLIGERYRHQWRVRAPDRLRSLARRSSTQTIAEPGALAHRGDSEPQRTGPSTQP
jgi:uncharacterized protein (UPF0548 family)